MEQLKKALSKLNINSILILSTIIIISMVYWNYLSGHLGADSYQVAVNYESYAKSVYLIDGRIFTFLFVMLASKLHIPMLALMSISVFLAIIISTISVLNIKNEVCKWVNLSKVQEVIAWLISASIIFNFMMTEIMYFPESCIMVSSILFYIIAARFFINKKDIKAFLFLLIGVFCYQGTIGFFVVMVSTFSIIKNGKIDKKFFADVLTSIIITGIAAMFNLAFIQIISMVLGVKQNKQFGLNIGYVWENIKLIFKSIYPILRDNCGLLYTEVFLSMICIVFGFSAVLSFDKKNNIVLGIVLLILISIICSFAMFVIQRGSLYTGRVHFCIGALIRSLSFIFILHNGCEG